MAKTANTSADRSMSSPPRPPPVAYAGGWPSPPPPAAAASADDDDDDREIAARDCLPPSPSPPPPTTADAFDAFLLSLTFASGGGGGFGRCDCSDEECGERGDPLPRDVRDAVDGHKARKRRRVEEEEEERRRRQPSFAMMRRPVLIRQERTLVRREGGFALWRLALPPGDGDPVVEYRSNHRVLFVERLDGVSVWAKLSPISDACFVLSPFVIVRPRGWSFHFHRAATYAQRFFTPLTLVHTYYCMLQYIYINILERNNVSHK